MVKPSRKIKKTRGEIAWDISVKLILFVVGIITLYPLIYVFSMSISEQQYVMRQEVWLFPKGFSLSSYKLAFENEAIWRSYSNTLWYTGIGTLMNVFMTVIGAYAISRRKFFARKQISFFITFTMFFSGGMIPLFILVNQLGLYDTRWAMILPTAVGAWYLIIARSFFEGLPESLEEAARIDGANDILILWKVYLPVSKPIIAVLILYYAVGHWNAYFNAMLYLPSVELQPLQMYLAKILTQNSGELAGGMVSGIERDNIVEQLKYASIIVAVLPILCVYPFLQKYFVKGVMVGAVKG